MTGQSSSRLENSGKNKISSVANAGRSSVFAQEEILATKYEILKENHDNLVIDYQCLEQSYKIVSEMNEMLQLHLPKIQKQPMESDAKILRLLKDFESERSEKEEFKKIIEGMKRMESEKEAMINELRIKNQELLIAKEKEEEKYKKMMAEEMNRMESEKEAMINEFMIKNQELLIAKEKEEEECKKIENKYVELTERFEATETECSFLKSLYDAENAIGQVGNDLAFKDDLKDDDDEVIVVDDHNVSFKDEDEIIVVDGHNVNNSVADAIVISDDSDAENDIPPRKSNITPQRSVGIKEEEQCSNGVNSPKVNYLLSPWSSSSSSSSEEHVFIELPVKRSRDEYNKS